MQKILAALALAFFLTGCIVDTLNYRVRLTVEIMVDGVIHSGNGVVEVQRIRQPNINGGGWQDVVGIQKGEAVFVDLGERGILFVTLQDVVGQYKGWSGFAALPDIAFGKRYPNGKPQSLSIDDMPPLIKAHAIGEANPTYMPMAVRFANIHDPASVELVDWNNLAASFGRNVSFVKAKVQMTDDPVTQKIERILPWLSSMGQFQSMGVDNRTDLTQEYSFNVKIISKCFRIGFTK